jgi:RNA polymerase sigma-70 factor (ECF subfamily)
MSNAKSAHRAAGEFATQRRKWLVAQARKLCRDASDAEDLVQETLLRFIQTFEKVERLPSDRTYEAWMVTTLTNLFYDQCRKRKVQAQGAQDPRLSEEAVVMPEPPTTEAYDTVTDEQFTEALKSLSPKIRATYELHAQGKTYQEIAQTLDIPVGTVGKRLSDARTKLRDYLKRYTKTGVH